MAAPKIFVSSTCYDLQEIRINLRKFIEDFGYEPIMSDFGDIFYDFDKHVQDSCIEAIRNSDMYILIIGDYYGSLYHEQTMSKTKIPDSVTLKEFKRALEIKKPKIIFINDYVQHDYQSYRKYLEKYYNNYFYNNNVDEKDISDVKSKLKEEVDKNYPFAANSYRYIFHFIDQIYELSIGNAFITFKNSQEIKDNLKKQWAGFLQENLKNRSTNILDGNINILSDKIDRIEEIIRDSFSSINKSNTEELNFDVDRLINNFQLEDLKEIQETLNKVLDSIIYDYDFNDNEINVIIFKEEMTDEKIKEWLSSLTLLLKKFKWSQHIPYEDLFSNFCIETEYSDASVLFENIFKLNSIFIKISGEDQESFIQTVLSKFKPLERIDELNSVIDDDDFPF